jgi:LacI family transcriptional regulator
MKRRPTRSDVAARAGVSKTTVTYVLGENYKIAIPESTRERVRQAARDLGYRPSAIAQALVSGRTNSIAIGFPCGIGPYYAGVLQAFERHTHAHGYRMIASSVGHIDFEKNVLSDLWSIVSGPNDGVILVDMSEGFRPSIGAILPAVKPIVSMGTFYIPSLDCVQVDLGPGAEAAMAHLLEASPERVGLYGSVDAEYRDAMIEWVVQGKGDPRCSAYCRAVLNAGLGCEMMGSLRGTRRASMDHFKAYVAEHGCPGAIFCFNDEAAICAHRALREMGYRLPEDVRLVGCDGSEECESLDPQISTIVQPVDAMCARAWDFLAARLRDPSAPPQHALLTPELVVRGSSRPNLL